MRTSYTYFIVYLLLMTVNISAEDLQNKLYKAAGSGDLKEVQTLVKAGADVNATSSALISVINNVRNPDYLYSDVMKFLINSGADVNVKNKYGTPLLSQAISIKKPQSFFLFPSNRAKKAAANERDQLLKSRYKAVEILINKNANVNDKDKLSTTPLMTAIIVGDLKIVKLLVQKKANVNDKNEDATTPLMMASAYGGISYDIAFKNGFLLRAGDLKIAKFLVQKRADVNAKNKNGTSPLIIACQYSPEIAKFLLQQKADVNAKNKDATTPLLSAVYGGNLDVIKILIKKGAKIDTDPPSNESALVCAVARKQKDIVKYLLEKRANVSVRNSQGQTLLEFVDDPEIKKLLIKHGAE